MLKLQELDRSNFDVDYGAWTLEEREIRAFLLATNRGMTTWFKDREAAAYESVRDLNPEDADGSEAYDAFMDDAGIFWNDYWERIAALVIKDAFRIYEVFLFESANRVARGYDSRLIKHGTEDSWAFPQCVQFYKNYLDIEVLPPKLDAAKWIRNKLTHLADLNSEAGRSELEVHKKTLGLNAALTDDERKLGLFHENNRRLFGEKLRFTPLQTWRILDVIREHTNVIGEAVHEIVWDRNKSTVALDNLSNGILVNPRVSSKKLGDSAYLAVPVP